LFRKALVLAYLLAGACVAATALRGASFYSTPLPQRARHPGYWSYKAGGSVGHPLGVAGSTMLLLLLGYSVRKRVRVLRRLGPLSRWLDVHIFLGLLGPVLVVLHSSFKVQGLVALSFWSMVVVALSGVVGRYLYLQIPRTRAGEAISLKELEAQDRLLSRRLSLEFGLDESALRRLETLSTPPPSRGLLTLLLGLLRDDLRRGRELRAFVRSCRGVPASLLRDLERLARQKHALHRRLLVWDGLHELFHYWHVVHKPFAVVMYLFMVVHVAVALATGYAWGTS